MNDSEKSSNLEKNISNNSRNKAILFFSLLSGILLSYFTTKYTFEINADVANSPIVWNEIKQHGFGILKEWVATPDNWYFSNYPIHFLLFKILGSSSPSVILWISISQLFFVAVISSLILRNLSGRIESYLAIPLLCFFNWAAHTVGYVSHPFSHNLINGYGLLCIFLYVYNRSINNLFLDALLYFMVLVAAVSDPWFLPAYYIPLLLATGADIFYFKLKKYHHMIIPLLTGCVLFSHVIEVFFNLPVQHFRVGSLSEMPGKIYWFFHSLGINSSLIPLNGKDSYITSGLLWVLFYFYSLVKINKIDSFLIISFLSIAGITGAFVLGDVNANVGSARFFTNVTYLIIITTLLAYFSSKSKFILSPLILICICSLLSYINHSIASNKKEDVLIAHPSNVENIASFLQANNLHYGFGPYWGMQAIAIGWATDNKYIVRPAYFDKQSGEMRYPGRAQTFNNWYELSDQPDIYPQYIAVTKDNEECQNLDLCLTGVKNQFGNPDNELVYQGIHFLIYNKKILGHSRLNISGDGEVILGDRNDKNIWKGFRSKEDNFRWTIGYAPEIYLSSEQWKRASIKIIGSSYQNLSGKVYVNKKEVSNFNLEAGNVEIPFEFSNQDKDSDINISIKFDALKSPAEQGLNSDSAKLGIAIHKIVYSVKR